MAPFKKLCSPDRIFSEEREDGEKNTQRGDKWPCATTMNGDRPAVPFFVCLLQLLSITFILRLRHDHLVDWGCVCATSIVASCTCRPSILWFRTPSRTDNEKNVVQLSIRPNPSSLIYIWHLWRLFFAVSLSLCSECAIWKYISIAADNVSSKNIRIDFGGCRWRRPFFSGKIADGAKFCSDFCATNDP